MEGKGTCRDAAESVESHAGQDYGNALSQSHAGQNLCALSSGLVAMTMRFGSTERCRFPEGLVCT